MPCHHALSNCRCSAPDPTEPEADDTIEPVSNDGQDEKERDGAEVQTTPTTLQLVPMSLAVRSAAERAAMAQGEPEGGRKLRERLAGGGMRSDAEILCPSMGSVSGRVGASLNPSIRASRPVQADMAEVTPAGR